MAHVNLPRLYAAMRDMKMDALVAVKPESFYYLTGFQYHMGGMQSAPGSGRQIAAAAVIPLNEAKQPAMLVSNWEEVPAKAASWIKDARVYPIWTEIFDGQALINNKLERIEKPHQFNIRQNCFTIADVLRERGLDKGTIGIETDYCCSNAISYFREALPKARFIDSSRMIWDVSAVKTSGEIEILRKATNMAQAAAIAVTQQDLLGCTVGEVRIKYQMAVLKLAAADPTCGYQDSKLTMSIGGDFAPKPGFAPYRAAMGDGIFFDPGVMLKGYMSDLGRTFILGKPSELQTSIYSALRVGLEAMLATVKPGLKCSEMFHIGQEAVRNSGMGLSAYTRGHLGHPIGVARNERPPYIAAVDHTVLEPGMTFSVECPLYVHGVGAFNIEDAIVITENGYELLNVWQRDLIQVK